MKNLLLYRLRCKEDKDATMTLAYRKAFPGHHMRTIDDEGRFVYILSAICLTLFSRKKNFFLQFLL